MIIEGLKLMVLGMAVVYLFLIILMLLTVVSSKLFKGHSVVSQSPNVSSTGQGDDILAVISAAIASFRKKKKDK